MALASSTDQLDRDVHDEVMHGYHHHVETFTKKKETCEQGVYFLLLAVGCVRLSSFCPLTQRSDQNIPVFPEGNPSTPSPSRAQPICVLLLYSPFPPAPSPSPTRHSWHFCCNPLTSYRRLASSHRVPCLVLSCALPCCQCGSTYRTLLPPSLPATAFSQPRSRACRTAGATRLETRRGAGTRCPRPWQALDETSAEAEAWREEEEAVSCCR